jgi:hypothetical protein
MIAANPFESLKKEYRSCWDAYESIAHENAKLLHDGLQPSAEQLVKEHLAAEAVASARRHLEAAVRPWH